MVAQRAVTEQERPLPYDINAERAFLGSILLERDAIIVIAPWFQPDYLYLEKHAVIYEAMLACYNHRPSIPPDISTVADELRRRGRLESIGGIAYLGELSVEVPTAVHVEYYGRIVERTALLRRLIQAGGKIAALGYNEREDLETTLDKAEAELFSVSQNRTSQEFIHIGAVVSDYFDQIKEIKENRGEIVGISSHYPDLDKLTGGLQRSDLVILAARPSVGKTSLALCIAYNVAMKGSNTVGIFSLEMSREQLVQRLLAMHTGIDMQRVRSGTVRDDDMQKLLEAMGELSAAPMYIEDTAGLSIMEVRSKARRLQAHAGVDLLIIDYLQLMQGRRSDNRVQEVGEISRGLKALARELDIPVIAISQLSRAVEGRTSHVPMLSDLRESGCLAGETKVYLPDQGIYRRIDQLEGEQGFRVLALHTETWKLEPRSVARAFATGYKPVYQLKTQLGRSIRATANHKFLTIQGWKRLDELKAGMRIALPRHLSGPSQETMSHAELALLGHLIGDGCTLPRHAIQYTTNDITLARVVVDLSDEVFGDAVVSRIKQERDWYQVYLSANYHLTHRIHNPIATWLGELGAFGLRSYEKYVPQKVFTQPVENIACFLRHLWSTDGCIQLVRGKKHVPTIYYATSSKLLAEDVLSLLLRLDIRAKIYCVSQGSKGRNQYHVIVYGKPDIQRFLDRIGGLGQNKSLQEIAIREHLEHRTANTNRDVIPRDIWKKFVVPSMQTLGMSLRKMHTTIGISHCGTGLYKQNVSRDRAARVAHAVQSSELLALSQSDVYWDTIVSLEPDGETQVYDLTVEGLHNFVAENIIVHNSIEQDADLVLFIYREELYDPETDKKGIAEIHIAKHRNGPLGIVPLRFENTTTRFQNLERMRTLEGY